MATPAEIYVEGIKRKLRNYYAAWLPNEPLKLGDVGVLDGAFFDRVTTVADMGISFEERPDPKPSSISYVSESGVEFFIKAAGEVSANLPNVPKGKAGLAYEFAREGAFVVKAEESYTPTIENIAKLEDDILEAYRDGKWKSNWAVIVKIVQAPTASFLISNSSNTKVEFSVEGDTTAGPIDLGNGKLNFGLRSQRGDVIQIVRATEVTPYFQLARMEGSWDSSSFFWFGGGIAPRFRAARTGLTTLDMATPKAAKANPKLARSLRLDLVRHE